MPPRAANANERVEPKAGVEPPQGARGEGLNTGRHRPGQPLPSLFGRQAEVERVRDLLDGVHGSGAALIVRGEPGIGKSALLAEARALAAERNMRIVSTVGARAEVDVPFAGLHQLLRPLRDELGALPATQRDVLLAAFGTDAAAPQLYAIAVAVLDLLATVAQHTALLIVAEDAHRLDRCTTDVLAFVARRLESDPIVLLAASRTGSEPNSLDEAGLDELELSPLEASAAAALLDAAAPGLAPALRERVLSEAAGNPLALVELPIAAVGVDSDLVLPTWLPLTTRLEQTFAARASELPATTRGLLLIAAVNDSDDLVEVLGAASLLFGQPISTDDLAPGVAERLVEADETTLHFRHSLVRSAVRQAASVSQRHAAHAALADALTQQPQRRVWHRAASIIGTDDGLADELETIAARGQDRGSYAEAVVALERAATLTRDRVLRNRRLLRAAELAFELGRRDVVERLLVASDDTELAPQERTRVMFIKESLQDSVPGLPGAAIGIADLADAAGQRGETDTALRLLESAGTRCWWGDYDEQIRKHMVTVATGLEASPDDPRLLAVLAWAAPIAQAAVVAGRLAALEHVNDDDPADAHLCGMAATAIGHLRLGAPFFDRAVDGLRSEGRLALLAQALVMRAWSGTRLGNWSQAEQDAEEGQLLARQTRQPSSEGRALAAKSAIAGRRGDSDAAAALADEGERIAAPAHARATLFDLQSARGLTALSAGRYPDAYAALRRVFDPRDPAYHSTKRHWVIADLAYAAAHTNQRELVRPLLAATEAVAKRTPSPDIRIAVLHATALLADDERCEPLFKKALDDKTSPPFDRARLDLAYGSWLRRQARVSESRRYLRAARDGFETLGAVPWTERAHQELRASGEKRRAASARDELTPQELQVAEMAADGLSNREIGQQLYLSHRTVGAHLYRLFPKLGVTARTDLRGALDRGVAQKPDDEPG